MTNQTNPIQFPDQQGSWNDYSMYNRMDAGRLNECKQAILRAVARAARTREANPTRYFIYYARLLALRLKLAEITGEQFVNLYNTENRRRYDHNSQATSLPPLWKQVVAQRTRQTKNVCGVSITLLEC